MILSFWQAFLHALIHTGVHSLTFPPEGRETPTSKYTGAPRERSTQDCLPGAVSEGFLEEDAFELCLERVTLLLGEQTANSIVAERPEPLCKCRRLGAV